MNLSKVYIVIINFGTPEHTIECIDSILQNNHPDFQVVLVDIQDKNDSGKKIKEWLPAHCDTRFTFLQTFENKGFAFANNIGIKYALKQSDCDYLWILNNDTVIEKNSITALINCQRKIEKPGFIGSKIIDYVNRDIIQNVGGTFNKWTGYSILIGMGEKDTGQFESRAIKPDYVIGASMFFQADLLKTIGLMPEDYFLYYEDIDWCITAQKAGFTNFSCVKSKVYHKQGISTGSKLLSADAHLKSKKHLYLSYLKFYRRHFPKFMAIAYFILIKQWAGRVYHGQSAEAKLIAQVIFSK